jgi:hypothetical protein
MLVLAEKMCQNCFVNLATAKECVAEEKKP